MRALIHCTFLAVPVTIPTTPIDPLLLFTSLTGGEIRSSAIIYNSTPETTTTNPFAPATNPVYPIAWQGEIFNLKMLKLNREFSRQDQGSSDRPYYSCLIQSDASTAIDILLTGFYFFGRREELQVKGLLVKTDRKPSGVIRLTIDPGQNVPIAWSDVVLPVLP